MRKYLYLFVATLFVFSCAKEQENLVEKNEPIINPQTEVTSASIFPDVFTADEEEVKTSYNANGIFSWVLNDEAAIYAVDNVTTPENQGWIAYQATALANDNKTATFIKVAGQTAKETAMASYTKTGIAVYPSSIASPSSGNTEATAYGAAFVTLPSSINGTASENVLIGTADDAENPTTFSFRSAMAQMRVTVTGIPAQAASLRLYTNDQEHFPLAGNFVLTANKEITHEDYRKVGESHSGLAYLSIDLPGTEIVSRDFFFSIPTGEYPANTLTLKMLDGDNNVLLEKTLSKIINFERNGLVRMSALANQWVTLGTGKFVDNFLWHHMGVATSTTNEVGYVDVTIQQNVVNTNKYRVANPYAAILTSVGKTQDASHSDYLEFTIVDANTVDFVTTNTGFNSGIGIVSIEDADGAYNKIVLGTEDDPQIVQLAPRYNSTGSFLYTRNTRDNLIRIAFPGVYEEHYATISISGRADMTSGINFVNHNIIDNYYRKVTISVSNNTLYSYYESQGNQPLPNTCVSKTDASGNIAKASLGVDNPSYDFKTSGVKYVFWSTYASNGTTVLFQGCKKFYFICASDIDSYIGQYDMIHSTGNTTLTLSVSDNLTIGNVQLSEVAGINGSLRGIYTPADHKLIFSRAYQYPFVGNTYIYSQGMNDLNLYLNYDGTSDEDYGNAEWRLITLDKKDLVVEIVGSSTTTYKKMRGNKAIVAP